MLVLGDGTADYHPLVAVRRVLRVEIRFAGDDGRGLGAGDGEAVCGAGEVRMEMVYEGAVSMSMEKPSRTWVGVGSVLSN